MKMHAPLMSQRAGRPQRLLCDVNPMEVKTISQEPSRDLNPSGDSTKVQKKPPQYAGKTQGSNYSHYMSGINPNRDLRPIREKSWQIASIKKVSNFILELGYRESLSMAKTFQAPSSKEFQSIFKFIYHRIDPSYIFQKKFEDEFVQILRNLKYPYVDQISRSHLYSVGSMLSWPVLLATLSWLVELIDFTCEIDKKLNPKSTNSTCDNSQPENIFFNYLTKAYSLFLSGSDDYEKIDGEFMDSIGRKNNMIEKEIENIKKMNEILEKEWKELSDGETPLSILQTEQKILESSKEKLRQEIMRLEAKKQSISLKVSSITQHIELMEARIPELNNEKSRLKEVVDNQKILASDVTFMNAQREQIQNTIDKTVLQIEKVNKESWEQEVLIQKAQDLVSSHKQELLRLSPRIMELNTTFSLANKSAYSQLVSSLGLITKSESSESLDNIINFMKLVNLCKDDILNSVQERTRTLNDSRLRLEKLEWRNISLESEIKDMENNILELNKKYNQEQELIGRINDTKSKEIEFYKQEVARARTDLHETSLNHFGRLQDANNSYATITMEYSKLRNQSQHLISRIIEDTCEIRERTEQKLQSLLLNMEKYRQSINILLHDGRGTGIDSRYNSGKH